MEFRIDFIIAGAQRSGTTALFYLLKEHPQVFFYPKKEAHFFTNNKVFEHDPVTYDSYHKLFSDRKPSHITGEGTPNYLPHPKAAQRIYQYNPAIKLIFLLRNPIDRAYSQYVQRRDGGGEPRSFEEAVRDEFKDKKPNWGYLSQGLYVKQLQRYIDLFPPEQLFIRTHDSFKNNNLPFLYALFEFLAIEHITYQNNPFERFIAGKYEPLSSSTRTILHAFYTPEIENLERLLRWDLSEWKQK